MLGLANRLQYMLSPQFDIYETVSRKVHGRVADIGSGTGFGTQILARNAEIVDGYDTDLDALDFAKRSFSRREVVFGVGDIEDGIGSVGDYYDFVVMIDVIEHVFKDYIAVSNCKRMLKNGGVFICSTPNRLSRYRKSTHHIREYSPEEFAKMLGKFSKTVDMVDCQLQPIDSRYSNPLVAICHKGGAK